MSGVRRKRSASQASPSPSAFDDCAQTERRAQAFAAMGLPGRTDWTIGQVQAVAWLLAELVKAGHQDSARQAWALLHAAPAPMRADWLPDELRAAVGAVMLH